MRALVDEAPVLGLKLAVRRTAHRGIKDAIRSGVGAAWT